MSIFIRNCLLIGVAAYLELLWIYVYNFLRENGYGVLKSAIPFYDMYLANKILNVYCDKKNIVYIPGINLLYLYIAKDL